MVSAPRPNRALRQLRPLALIFLVCIFLLGTLLAFHLTLFRQSTNAHASDFVSLPGHVPTLVKKSQLLGATNPDIPVTILVGVHLRDQASLASYVGTIAHPHSVTARHYLTPAQVAAAYGPLPASTNAVIAYMQQAGFTETMTYKHHLLIAFTGTIGEAESAFHVQINNYRSPGGIQFYAPTTDPGVPVSLANIIQSINGLDTVSHFTHPPILSSKAAHTLAAPRAGNCGSQGYTPNQIASAYKLAGLYNTGFLGEGQTVALYELDDYNINDIHTYISCYGGSSVPINRIAVNGGTTAPAGSGAIEVELDMELVLSAAPHLASLDVYEAKNDNVDALAEWSQIVNDAVPVVSTSWGQCEPWEQ